MFILYVARAMWIALHRHISTKTHTQKHSAYNSHFNEKYHFAVNILWYPIYISIRIHSIFRENYYHSSRKKTLLLNKFMFAIKFNQVVQYNKTYISRKRVAHENIQFFFLFLWNYYHFISFNCNGIQIKYHDNIKTNAFYFHENAHISN